jgi:ectoine hydroxylase-related dioxygenase (phytanoyl-CoA dioxygenase family)
LARWAAQLIGCRQLRLLEDDAIYKMPGKGGSLMWHQDYPYWPIAQPNAVTAWLALDDTTVANGAMRMAVGTHLTGETLPAAFGSGKPYLQENRPRTVQPIGDPEILGYDVLPIELRAGEVSLHHALTWHCSTANESTIPRRAFVVRYVADGTIWLGARRYNEYRLPVDAGVVEGEPLTGRYFPVVPF